MLKLYNTLTRKKEILKPIKKNQVSLKRDNTKLLTKIFLSLRSDLRPKSFL